MLVLAGTAALTLALPSPPASACCSSSSWSPTGRRSRRIPAAAAPTSSPRRTSARCRGSSRARRCWSTTSSPWRSRSRRGQRPSPPRSPRCARASRADRDRARPAARSGQPARRARVRRALRRPHLLLHRDAGAYGSGGPRAVALGGHDRGRGLRGGRAQALQSLTLFLVLKAFASGCTAMTGVEAIANGVQAFKQPEAKNAAQDPHVDGGHPALPVPRHHGARAARARRPGTTSETVISQLARGIFGTGWIYYADLGRDRRHPRLAANTAYADFPRLASFMADDDSCPKQLTDRGYRLVYSNGIVLLTMAAIGLLVASAARRHRLIPLYAVGVFTSFHALASRDGRALVEVPRGGLALEHRRQRRRRADHRRRPVRHRSREVHARSVDRSSSSCR